MIDGDNLKNGISNIGEQVGELLHYISELEKENAELEKEIAELKKDKEWLDNTNNEQTEVILKLNEQIERMKCCGNCSKRNRCEMNVIDSLHCDNWS